MSTTEVIEVPAGALYDARRNVYYHKPLLRGWLHLITFEASLVIGTLLLAHVHGRVRITGIAIYAASVSGLFGVSALYHLRTWSERGGRIMQRLDHTMIFLLIAGTATPAFLIAAPETYGRVCLIVLWSLTALAVGLHLSWMNAPELLVGASFVGMGWMAGLALPPVWMHSGVAPGLLMLAGGVLYMAGAASYHRRVDPLPRIFGYHEVFHAYVCAAAACQYVAIALFVV